MVRTLCHKLFSQGQSGIHRGHRWALVRQRLMQKPLLEPLEDRALLSLIAPVVYDTPQGTAGLAVGDLRGNGRLDIVTAGPSVSVLLGNGDGTFQPAVDYATGGSSARFVALGQLQPGGPLDVITANPGSDTVSVLLGKGDGTFRPAVQYTAAPSQDGGPIAVAVGNFTANGIPDIVTVNVKITKYIHIFTYSVLAGNGDGTFQTAVTQTLPKAPSSLAAGEFTANGHLSIAVGTSAGVMVLLGNGNGTFQAPVFYAAEPKSTVSSILVSDLAGTGRLDLVTANDGTDTVSVLLGNGNGTFGPATNYTVGAQDPLTVAAGRFQPGGPLDLVTNVGSDSVSVLPGAGNGTFGAPSQYFAGDSPSAVATGDFAGQGIDDIAVTNRSQGGLGMGAVSMLLNPGNGAFQPLPIQLVGQYIEDVATGDFRGNGIQDLVTANEVEDTVSVFLGNGNGTFGAPQTFPAGTDPIAVVVGDFNGDGKLDLAVAEAGGSTTVSLLLGNGNGTFQAPLQIPAGGEALSIAAGHFHNPKILDLVTLDYNQNSATVLLGNGNGTFKPPVSYPVGQDPTSVAVGDLLGNGITDLVVANGDDNTVSVLLGNGNGTFRPAVNYSMSDNTQVANFPRFVMLGSLRNNGRLDIVTTNFGSSNVTVLLGNGDGTFGAPIHLDAGVGSDGAAIADFNGDGNPDVLVTNNATDTVTLLPGNGDGTFRAPVQYATGPGPFAMSVGNFDGQNPEVAVLNASTISVMLNDSGKAPAGGAAFAIGAGQIAPPSPGAARPDLAALVTANLPNRAMVIAATTSASTFDTRITAANGIYLPTVSDQAVFDQHFAATPIDEAFRIGTPMRKASWSRRLAAGWASGRGRILAVRSVREPLTGRHRQFE